MHVSDPTWANHEPLIGSSGMRLERYPYFDATRRAVAFDAMLSHIDALPPASLVLLHACCHNPTEPTSRPTSGKRSPSVVERRGLVPFVDLAYQGFGDDLETDVAGLRTLAQRVPELLLSISCSKNFGLYRERTGALAVVSANGASRTAVATHQARFARRMYSMPPDHGAAIVARVLADASLRQSWQDEVGSMVARMKSCGRCSPRGWPRGCRPTTSAGSRVSGECSRCSACRKRASPACGTSITSLPRRRAWNVTGLGDANVDYVAEQSPAWCADPGSLAGPNEVFGGRLAGRPA